MPDKERSELDKLAAQVAQASTGGEAGGELGITARKCTAGLQGMLET